MNSSGILSFDNDIYFAPLKYLIDYAKFHQQTINTLMTKHHVPKLNQNHILKMETLNHQDLKYLTLMTNVSQITWQNLDNDWQAGQIKYQNRHQSFKKE